MDTKKPPFSRRKFITSVGIAAPVLAGLPASSASAIVGANKFLRLGWIGVGGRGTSLLRKAMNSVSVSNLKVTAICDLKPDRRNAGVNISGGQAASIENYKDLLARKDVDAVFIATPIHLHREHAVAAVQAGKHIYCEKPLGPTAADVKAVYDAVKGSKIKFQVGFQWRYHSGFLSLVDAVQSGKVGSVTFVHGYRHVGGYPTAGWYVDRKLSGDLIVEQAVHEMNVFCWMLKSHPLRAAGFGGINALKGVPQDRTIMDHYSVTYEFTQNITLAYSHCVYTANGFGGLRTTVHGTGRRAVQLDDTLKLSITDGGKATPVETPPLRDPTELAIQSFAKSIREDREPLANVDAGRHATLMAILGRTAIHEKRVAEWKEVANG